MRGEADTNLGERRPADTYFFRGDENTFTREGQPMKGGINGGLVLFEPSESVHEQGLTLLSPRCSDLPTHFRAGLLTPG